MPSLANVYCHDVPSGMTLTGEVYPDGSDTAALGGTGLTCTEQTNRKGTYNLNVGVTGLHRIVLKSGSEFVWGGWTPSNLANTGDFEACATRREALNLDGKISDIPSATTIADTVIRRNQSNVEGSSDGDALALGSLYGLMQQAQESNTTDNAGKLTIYKTDGTTELAQKTITTDGDAVPVTGVS